ncbi:neuronal acetylcholine receptor subunit alpha-10-like [Mytilus trossulus]|uniref:neuronal acetylcholine receptor subunit alpha-10-like n=1 Tax=Mytilus trossulus TaxID=6551 RepID=UPI0030074983
MKTFVCCIFYPVALIFLLSDVNCSSYTKQIAESILTDYDTGLRPVCEGITQVNLTMGVAVRQLIGLDEPNQVVKLNLWVRLKWNDCLLQWNASDFNNTQYIIVPIKRIWVPDVTLFDSITIELSGMKSYKAIIYPDGTVYYNFPTLIESICPIDVTSFPFDSQMCPLVFGSWVYHGLQLDIQPRNNPGDLSSMKKNVEWIIEKVEVERHVLKYGCCPEPYPDITFYIYLQRKPAYYVTNIIIPSLIITVLAILGYFLPVESGEKASLVITIMLSLSVFQLLVADKLPPSADATPWLMFFFNFILGMSAVSTMIQVAVINTYYRGEKVVSAWMTKYFIVPLCFITMVQIPGYNSPKCIKKNQVEDIFEKDKEPTNTALWKCFSVALDRLGILLFVFTVTVGCGCVFGRITS